MQPLSLDAFGEPLPHSFNAFTASVCNLNPTSPRRMSEIRSARSGDAAAHRRRLPRRPTTTARSPPRACRVTRRIVAQPALARFKPRELLKPGPRSSRATPTPPSLAGDIGTIDLPSGPARPGMGPAGDPMAVVDAHLRRARRRRPARRSTPASCRRSPAGTPTGAADADDRRARRRVAARRRLQDRRRAYSFHRPCVVRRVRDESPRRSQGHASMPTDASPASGVGAGQAPRPTSGTPSRRSPTSPRSSPPCCAATTCSRSSRRRTG